MGSLYEAIFHIVYLMMIIHPPRLQLPIICLVLYNLPLRYSHVYCKWHARNLGTVRMCICQSCASRLLMRLNFIFATVMFVLVI
jgi:hypothetical protein